MLLPFRRFGSAAFTLIELLTVITIIVILMGLIVGVAGFANTKAARSRAEGEMRALSTAMENYKSDNAVYPQTTATNMLDPRAEGDPTGTITSNNKTDYTNASRDLYAMLSGQVTTDASGNLIAQTPLKYPPAASATGARNYWGDLKPSMLAGVKNGVGTVTAINDPWGMSYGYSTANKADTDANVAVASRRGYNPTFDLWSVANKLPASSAANTATTLDSTGTRAVWIVNW